MAVKQKYSAVQVPIDPVADLVDRWRGISDA